jgi:hypothetical protein
MSQIRAILFRLRATVVLVAVAAVFGGALFSAPAARAASASLGLTAPCDHHPAIDSTAGAPIKRAGFPGHCPDCCLFGELSVLALPVRASSLVQPTTDPVSMAVYAATPAGATEFILTGAANGARAPPVAI